MTTLHFHMDSSLSPKEVVDVLTDFSSERPEEWPSIDAEHFTVHDRGANWAEVTEGTESAWERARYEWDPAGNTVTVTTHESKVFGTGGGWQFKMTPHGDGSRIDVELDRHPHTFGQKVKASILPFAGPVFRKSFKKPLRGV